MSKIYTFINKDIDINRDPLFNEYYLRTNQDYKIVNISAGKVISSSKNEFNNKFTS